MLKLYFAPGASSMAPHIALHEVGAAFDGIPLSNARRETRDPAFLAVNPEGKVPALLIDDRLLTEVAAILFYLARAWPDAGLMPEGIEREAQAVSWMSFIAATLHPSRRLGLHHAMTVWRLAEARLAGREWCVGDHYSIADIHLFRLFWRLNASLKPDPDDFPALLAHHDRVIARPAVQRTIAIESAIGYELPA